VSLGFNYTCASWGRKRTLQFWGNATTRLGSRPLVSRQPEESFNKNRQVGRNGGLWRCYSRQSRFSCASCCLTTARSQTWTRRKSTDTAKCRPSVLSARGSIPLGNGNKSSRVLASYRPAVL